MRQPHSEAILEVLEILDASFRVAVYEFNHTQVKEKNRLNALADFDAIERREKELQAQLQEEKDRKKLAKTKLSSKSASELEAQKSYDVVRKLNAEFLRVQDRPPSSYWNVLLILRSNS